MVARAFSVVALAGIASLAVAVPFSSEECVLGSDGLPACSRSDSSVSMGDDLSPIARPATCGDTDVNCWCLRSVELTNDIRARKGDGTKLISGPAVMVKNAVDWSKVQMASNMKHQSPLPKIGCGIQINRENVAMHGGIKNDPIAQCMKQWEGSPGHFRNIVGAKAGTMVVVGLYKQGNKVYCTQTFSQSPIGTGECAPISGSSPAPADSKAPAKPAAPMDTNMGSKAPGYKQPAKDAPTDSKAPAKPAAPMDTNKAPEAPTADGGNAPKTDGDGADGYPDKMEGTTPYSRAAKFCKWFLKSEYSRKWGYRWILYRCHYIVKVSPDKSQFDQGALKSTEAPSASNPTEKGTTDTKDATKDTTTTASTTTKSATKDATTASPATKPAKKTYG